MRKIELVQLHVLLRLLKRHAEAGKALDEGAFEAYESIDVTPMEVYKPKERHREAVLTLARELADALAVSDRYRPADELAEAGSARG